MSLSDSQLDPNRRFVASGLSRLRLRLQYPIRSGSFLNGGIELIISIATILDSFLLLAILPHPFITQHYKYFVFMYELSRVSSICQPLS